VVVVVVAVAAAAAAAAVVTSDLYQELPKFPVVSLLLRKLFCASKNKSSFSLHSQMAFLLYKTGRMVCTAVQTLK
jgi:hypothetical protein